MQSRKQKFTDASYVLMQDASGTLYCSTPFWAVSASLRDGWLVLHNGLTYDECMCLKHGLYAGIFSAEEILEEAIA